MNKTELTLDELHKHLAESLEMYGNVVHFLTNNPLIPREYALCYANIHNAIFLAVEVLNIQENQEASKPS